MNKKILIIGLILIIGSLIFVPWEIKTSRIFSWQQELPEPNDLAGWKLYQSTTPRGPYTLIDTIPFTISQAEYTAVVTISDPVHQVTTLYFIITAFDTAGKESSYSNEVSMRLDLQAQGIMGYDFIWSGKRYMTVNYRRVFFQIISIIIGTVLVYILTLRRGVY